MQERFVQRTNKSRTPVRECGFSHSTGCAIPVLALAVESSGTATRERAAFLAKTCSGPSLIHTRAVRKHWLSPSFLVWHLGQIALHVPSVFGGHPSDIALLPILLQTTSHGFAFQHKNSTLLHNLYSHLENLSRYHKSSIRHKCTANPTPNRSRKLAVAPPPPVISPRTRQSSL